jgi:uncharacterized cupredoxin-like copper-binding protein
MKTPTTRLLVSSVAILLLLAACGGTATTTWTIAPALPTSTAGPSAGTSAAPGSPTESAATSPAAGQVIRLELTGVLSITQDGEQVTELTVKEGETVHFVIDNTAGFDHNFYIGTADQLSQDLTTGLPGIPKWGGGIQEFDYAVTAETAGLQFACTLPGHYGPMHGTFKVVP